MAVSPPCGVRCSSRVFNRFVMSRSHSRFRYP
jgi:hypothetical protein